MGTYTSELSAIGPKTAETGKSQLGVGFEPSDFSVICGRSYDNQDHAGNRCFHELASTFVERYSQAFSQTTKAAVVFDILPLFARRVDISARKKRVHGSKLGIAARAAR
jgi:hypothetical protein